MPAPLVGIAVAAAARLAAKKLAQQGAKKVAKTAATRARSNSAAASKMVAQKASLAKRQQLIAAQDKLSPKEMVRTNSAFQARIKSVLPERVLQGRSVKQVSPTNALSRATTNTASSIKANIAKSGERAKAAAKSREKAIAASRTNGTMAKPVKIKSGGNIKPATAKKTIASHPANVGRAPSPDRVKWDLETAKLTARKGKTVKINSK